MGENMNPSEQFSQLIQTAPSSARERLSDGTLDKLVVAIADDEDALNLLDTLSAALTDLPSSLREEVQRLQKQGQLLEHLGAYVEAEFEGRDARRLYPNIAHLIEISSAFRKEYESLSKWMVEDELFDERAELLSPDYWSQEQKGPDPAADVDAEREQAMPSLQQLWQPLQGGLHQLMAEIPIFVSETMASFGELPSPFTRDSIPTAVLRNHASGQRQDTEQLSLSEPTGLLTTRIQLGPLQSGLATLIVEVLSSEAELPESGIKVTLSDHHGELLERVTTDEQGRVTFERLEPALYQIRVNQSFEFTVNLQQKNAP